jgi:small ligand-binding sensory domain FIST
MSASQSRRVRFASAVSAAAATTDALREVTASLCEELSPDGKRAGGQEFFGGGADLVMVFATMHHAEGLPGVCEALQNLFKPRVLLACTCNGVIGVRHEVQQGPGLSVLVGEMPGAALQGFSYEQFDWPAVLESPSAMRETIDLSAQTGDTDTLPSAILLLADPYSAPMVKLLPAFASAFGPIPVLGGMASGAEQAGQNLLILNGEVASNGAVGVAIGGNIDVQTTVSQGCRAIGEPMVITRSKRHVVQELGGRNALTALRELASSLSGDDRELLESNGLHVGRVINEYKGRFGRGDFLIREMVGVDAEQGYIAIGDPGVRTGQTIQFHVRDADSARDDFQMMLSAQKVHGEASGALLFSCNGRGEHLFDKPHADAGMVYDALGGVPLAGFFAAGEIGPIGGQSYIHGHTTCLAVFRGV